VIEHSIISMHFLLAKSRETDLYNGLRNLV